MNYPENNDQFFMSGCYPDDKNVRKIDNYYAGGNDLFRRSQPRKKITVPATIIYGRGNKVHAQIRDISGAGLGLVHFGVVDPLQEVECIIYAEKYMRRVQMQMLWCQQSPVHANIYMSGGKFTSRIKTEAY